MPEATLEMGKDLDSTSGAQMLLIYLTVIVLAIGFFAHWFTKSHATEAAEEEKVITQKEKKKEKKKRGGMGRRGGNDVQEAAGRNAANETNGEDDEDEGPMLSKKEQRKKDAKDAKAEAKADREEASDKKRDKQSNRDQKYADRDAAREQMEEDLAKEEAEREAVREKEAQEEVDKWKDMFTIGEAGTEADLEASETQGRLAEFIEHIECKKVVAMEDLAAHFDMRPQDVLKRVEDLLMMERISGVIDDRGKFICITKKELQDVVKFMRRRGRVNVTDLAAESNKLIDLTPKDLPVKDAATGEEDVAK